MAKIWKIPFTKELLQTWCAETLVHHLGIKFTEFGDDFLKATLPVDERTVQPMRLLHGGASAALAETLGSIAGMLCVDDFDKQATVGIELNINHLKAVREGKVTGTVTPIRIGKTIQVWNIDIHNDRGQLTATSRLTLAVVNR